MAKLTVMFKMPDAVSDAIRDAQREQGLSNADAAKAEKVAEKFVEYGEYVYLELDTETKTMRVMARKEFKE